jgi:ribosome-binding factor A
MPALGRATPYLRSRLGQDLKLRFTPQLHFKADTSFNEAARIDELLRQPRVQQDLNHPEEPDESGAPDGGNGDGDRDDG